MHRPHKPADVELLAQLCQAGALGDEDERAIPNFFQLLGGEHVWLLRLAIQDEGFAVEEPHEDEEAGTIAPRGNGGEGGNGEVRPGAALDKAGF